MSDVRVKPAAGRWMSRDDIIRDFGIDIAARRDGCRSGLGYDPANELVVRREEARQLLASLLSEVDDECDASAHVIAHRSGNPAITPLCCCDSGGGRGPRARLLCRLLHGGSARRA